jgi:glycosyltransferase 2 family protein
MDRLMRSRALRALAVAATLAATVATLLVLARGTSPAELLRALKSADGWLLALGVLPVLAVSQLFRTGRFSHLLRDSTGRRPRFAHVLAAVVVSQAANNVLPLRAGEAVRTREIVLRGFPVARVVSAQLLEKLIELVVMVLLVAPVVAFGAALRVPAGWLAAGALALLLAALFLRRARRARDWLARVTDWSRGDLAASVAWALAADVAEVAVIALTARSVGVALGVAGSVAVLGAVNLAIALPSTPANLGTLEAGAAVALVAMGVSGESALTFALVYRAIQFVPITLGGAAIVGARGLPTLLPLGKRSVP